MTRFPRTRQRDITDCGAACLHAVAQHHGMTVPVARIRQYASTDREGTSVLGMVDAAVRMGFVAKGVRGPFESLAKIPKPAIAHVVRKDGIQHFVVLVQVTAKHVVVMDPSDGEIHRSSHEEFKAEWTGVLVLIVPAEDFEAVSKSQSTLARFWALVRPHRSIFAEALVGAALISLLGLAMAVYVQKLVDHVLVGGNRGLLNLMSIVMLVLVAVRVYMGAMKSLFILRTGQKIDAVLILGYYQHLLSLPQRFFDTMRVGEIISRVGDAVKIRAFINDVAIELCLSLFVVLFSFAFVFAYSWRLGILLALTIPVFGVVYVITNRINRRTQRQMMEAAADLESHLVESISGAATIKRFGVEEFANFKTETHFAGLLGTVYRSGTNAIFTASATAVVSQVTVVLLLWYGAFLVLSQQLTPGGLMSVYALAGHLLAPLLMLVRSNRGVQDAMIAADRLFEILDLEAEEEGSTAELCHARVDAIRFEGVTFRYGTREPVFQGLDLTIPAGRVTGIVGESGCGKSTLMALLQKLYPLETGKILYGDLDLRYASLRSVRRAVTTVAQEVDLFSGSVLENIALGDPAPDVQRALEVCQQAGIGELIDALPEGLDTRLSGGHGALSAGEKQRLAIARALYPDPEVIVFDEATSALDSATESKVQETIQELAATGKTIILIAHRLSTVVNAHKIVVIGDGRVLEEGDHATLMRRRGEYYKMWRYQIPPFMLLDAA